MTNTRFWKHVGLIGFIFFYGLLLSSSAQKSSNALKLLPIDGNSFKETQNKDGVVLSSGVIVGGTIAMSSNFAPDNLVAYLPRTVFPKLCIAVMSRDGSYEAKGAYAVRDKSNGKYRLEFPTKISDVLEDFSHEQITVLVTATDDCRKTGQIIISGWENPDSVEAVTIYLNTSGSEVSTFLRIPTKNGGSRDVRCRNFEEAEKKTAYDTICEFYAEKTDLLEKTKIFRYDMGVSLPEINLPIIIARR